MHLSWKKIFFLYASIRFKLQQQLFPIRFLSFSYSFSIYLCFFFRLQCIESTVLNKDDCIIIFVLQFILQTYGISAKCHYCFKHFCRLVGWLALLQTVIIFVYGLFPRTFTKDLRFFFLFWRKCLERNFKFKTGNICFVKRNYLAQKQFNKRLEIKLQEKCIYFFYIPFSLLNTIEKISL